MSDTPSEVRLASAFAELADTLVDNFDVIDFLHTLTGHAVSLLELDAARVLLANALGQPVVTAVSTEATRQLELSAATDEQSPGRDCLASGRALADTPLDSPDSRARWPHFAPAAQGLGFTHVAAVPMRLRDQVIGALTLFHHRPIPLGEPGLRLAQALADTATIAILQQRVLSDQTLLAVQLQETLQARITIDQAQGIIVERRGLSTEDALRLLREQSRSQRRLLTDLAHQIIEEITDRTLLDAGPTRPAPEQPG